MIRVIVADDHHLVRQGIGVLLQEADDIEVVGEAEDGEEAVELVERLAPDVVVMDVAMPRLNGILAAGRLQALGVLTRVVILSMYSDGALVYEALRNGAQGYLLKRSVAEELLLAVRAAARGEIYLSPAIPRSVVEEALAEKSSSWQSDPFDRLTPREQQVLQLIAEGRTNQGVANLLHISVKTVEKHRANLMSKLDIHDVPGLTRIAIKHRLVSLNG